ncbi:MAG: sigma-70 family RNA polymerase sigma factor [Planctomycetota bacterium]
MSVFDDLTHDEMRQLADHGFSLAKRFMRVSEDAADMVQEAWLQMWNSRDRFDPSRGSLRSWFLTMVRSRCLDQLRRSRSSSLEADWAVVDPESGPAERASASDEASRVRACLNQMPEDAREILVLRDFHGLSYREIAGVLSIPQGTVMSRLHRARNDLRARFDAPNQDSAPATSSLAAKEPL